MKIIAPAAALASALSLARAAALGNKKDTALVRLVAADSAASVACTGSAITITASIAADVTEPGQIAVATDRLAGLAAGFPPTAKLTVSVGAGFATICSGNSKSRLPLIPLDDLPQALAVDAETGRVEITGTDLLTLLEPLAAADNELTRYYLSGIFWHTKDDKLVAVATNGSRLIKTSIAAGPLSEAGLILPRDVGAILSRLIRAAKPGKLSLSRSRTLLAVEWPGLSFVSRLIDATYPAYSRVIPPASPASVTCSRTDLIAALLRFGAVAPAEPTPLVTLSFGRAPQLCAFLARQPYDGDDTIAAATVGEGRVVVPLAQLAAMLSEFSGARVRLDIGDGERPVLIHGDDGKLGLLMPCRFNFSNRNEKESAAAAA